MPPRFHQPNRIKTEGGAMRRKIEFVDIWVSIGMVATVLGAFVFFQASNGGAGFVTAPAEPVTNPPMKVLVQSMLQPAMPER